MDRRKLIQLLSLLNPRYPAAASDLIFDLELEGEAELRQILQDIDKRGIKLVVEENPLTVRVRGDCWATVGDLVNRMSVLLV